jgi:hypothetical protein
MTNLQHPAQGQRKRRVVQQMLNERQRKQRKLRGKFIGDPTPSLRLGSHQSRRKLKATGLIATKKEL